MASPWIFGFLLAITGCSTRPSMAPAHAPSAAWSPSAGYLDAKSDRVRSRSLDFPIEFMLPAKASFRISDGPVWLDAEQRESSSAFAFRTWRADRLVRRDECERQARVARVTIPALPEDAIVDRRAFAAPAGFDLELIVGVEPSTHGVAGYAMVFGASVGRCYAALFSTEVAGAGADREVAARLGFAVDRVLSGVRARSVDERAPRRHLVASPQ
jgi:hypothetical protein